MIFHVKIGGSWEFVTVSAIEGSNGTSFFCAEQKCFLEFGFHSFDN